MTGISGDFPDVALRNYGGRTTREFSSREIGIRVVLASVARAAARFGKAIDVLCSFLRVRPTHNFNKEHYIALYIQVNSNDEKVNECLDKIQEVFIFNDASKQNCIYTFQKQEETTKIGPLWTGNILNKDVIKLVYDEAKNREYIQEKAFMKMLRILLPESEYPDLIFYYQISDIGPAKLGIKDFIKAIQEAQYRAVRCQSDSNGFKTDAPFEVLKNVYNGLV
eukprot:TRINITY_DN2153_c0_g1_i7.p1 TRINITY_DN2153_c0_g1~~TRINITY_DN2153_c0_g1_i7.p1  ORF type:complete len:223 (-),score=43.85 TRINITY_DN2153_c0_g1_i7:227-895(-)